MRTALIIMSCLFLCFIGLFSYQYGCIVTRRSLNVSSIEQKAVAKFIASRTPYIWMDGFNGHPAPVGYTGPRWIMVDESEKIPTNIREMPDTVESTVIIKLDK